MTRRYDSFVLRCWCVSDTDRRIEVEHLQTGRRTRVGVFDAAAQWITTQCDDAERKEPMPLFMDVHSKVDGATAAAVADAHLKDLEVQDRYGVKYLKYWFDEGAGRIFCLVEAPNKEAATRVHREAHGLVADEIFQVTEGS